MSLIKSIKQQLGLSGTPLENYFWDASVPNNLSLKRGTPDAPGAEIINALNGVLSFPNQGQLLAANGYIKLPGGLIIQWGKVDRPAGNYTVLATYPIPFPTAALVVQVAPLLPSAVTKGTIVDSFNASAATIGYGDNTSVLQLMYVAIGH